MTGAESNKGPNGINPSGPFSALMGANCNK